MDFESLSYDDIPGVKIENFSISNAGFFIKIPDAWKNVVCDFRKNGYRLPTAAEWEIAARGGLTGDVYPGTVSVNKLDAYAWYGRNSENRTHEVKKKQPNGYGLYDMGGNVLEWCWDWGGAGEYRKTATDPTGPYIPYSFDRMVHGSYWGDEDHLCKVYRISSDPSYYRHWTVGFRVVRSVVVD